MSIRDISKTLDEHYQQAQENLALVSGEDLHFVGYFENQDDSLPTALRNLNRLFATKASVTPSDLVLDVGCGTGGPACHLAETVGCRVVGIDIGDSQLERARKLATAKHLTHLVNFYHQDATQMFFQPQQFDVALLMGSASNIRTKEKLFAECARVTKEQGRLVLGDVIMADPGWFRDPKNAAKVKIINVFFANPFLESLHGYRNLIQDHGFQNLDVFDLSRHMQRSFDLWTVTLEEGKSEFVKRLGNARYRSLVKGVKIVGEIVQDGKLGCVIITATKQRG
jgi:27-O-demethylrifamycin SV methyltransferase